MVAPPSPMRPGLRNTPWIALVFVVCLALSGLAIWHMEVQRRLDARNAVYNQASDQVAAIQNRLDRALSAVYALATLVQQSRGHMDNFEEVGLKMLPYYPGVAALALAPQGIITQEVPLRGNEAAIGLNLLEDPVMRTEAQVARSSGRLTLAGPLELRQGGVGLVARLPVFLPGDQGTPVFWGLTNIVLRLPQALADTGLADLAQRRLDFKLWRVNPDTGETQVILQSGAHALVQPVQQSFEVPNGAWTLSVAPRDGWGDPAGVSIKALGGLLISGLLAYLALLQWRQMAYRSQLQQQVAEQTADIRASQMQLSATLDAIPDLLYEMDIHGRYIDCHAPRAGRLIQPVHSLIGKTVNEVMPAASAATVLQALAEAQDKEVSYGKQLTLPVQDELRWFELSVARKPALEPGLNRFIVISHDITSRKLAEEHALRLAYFDTLTGLPNRSLLDERIHQALAEAARRRESLCLMFLDLDHFKNINDTLGHRMGDQLLMILAQRMQQTVREQDTVARLGGDEFIVLLPDTGARGATRVAEKLMHAMGQPVRLESHELDITVSIGIAMYPEDGDDAESLSRHADAAMYRAKTSGRSGFQFYLSEMQAQAARMLLLDNELRRALNRGQFELHYQPQLSLMTGQVVGVEALLRWEHPRLGRVSPAEFIPVAESNGQILPIGEWVLRTAAAQARKWQAMQLPSLTVAVNLSAVQFKQPRLVELVADVLAQEQLPAHLLELELTESVAQQNPENAIAIMARLHDLGVRLSIDDFGTGYSSLNYLKRFAAHQLKIDQSFVNDITRDPDDLAIVRAIISMARSLGLSTIAEGVETEEQLQLLLREGCDEVQGYLICRPLTPTALEQFLARPSQLTLTAASADQD